MYLTRTLESWFKEASRQFPVLPVTGVRVGKTTILRQLIGDGTSKMNTRLDKPGIKGYAVGFEGLIDFVNGQIPTNEVIETALRHEVKMFPEIAIRELVANALIHQDFMESGSSVMIEIYSDRIDNVKYQHCCLRYVMNQKMTNQSLRDRFKLPEKKTESVSRVIRDAMEAEIIKLTDPTITSLRYRSYVPFWA